MHNLIEELKDHFVNLAQPQYFNETVKEILRYLISHSQVFLGVWHPLGFINIKLDAENTVRLHIWNAASTKRYNPISSIHNHEWQLTSYVIIGTLYNHTYQVIKNPALPTHQLCRVKSQGLVNYIELTDTQVAYTLSRTEIIVQGEIYTVPPRVFHSTSVKEDITTATIMLESPGYDEDPEIIVGPDHHASWEMTRKACTGEELHFHVAQLLDQIT